MSRVDLGVVKSYDIRGTYPDQLDGWFAYMFGRALPRVIDCERAALGWDARLSSPELAGSLTAGLRHEGVQVGVLGMCPTEFVYFAAGSEPSVDLGLMVTASHNPPEYNGLKVVRGAAEPVTGSTGLCEIVRLMGELDVEADPACNAPEADVALCEAYVDFALDLVGAPDTSGLSAIVDAGNGVGGMLWDLLQARLGVEPWRMNCRPDGHFPAHHPDPSRRENLLPLIEQVAERSACLGFSYDGDADRVVVVTEDGHVVDGSEMTACIALRLLEREPGSVFGVGQTTSRKVLDYFTQIDVEPVMVPVGHSKIKTVLRATPEMVFAGEDAGHYYYHDFYHCDSSLITTLHLLHMVADGRLAELVGSFAGPWYRPRREPSFKFDDKQHALEVCRTVAERALERHGQGDEITCERGGRVARNCAPDKVADCDGVRVDYEDWWFCVRPSGTEPIARLALEARSPALLQRRMAELTAMFTDLTAE